MSAAPPPPPAPPAPPPPPATPLAASSRPSTKIQLTCDECGWAVDYPELQKSCFLSRVCQFAQPRECHYYDISSVLQIGPTCGLTALSMLLNGQPSAEELLGVATRQKYTINGEMFSARYLYELTLQHLKSPLKCDFYEGVLNCAYIREQLMAGCCLFVPYDADVNHAPCQKSGHRAHWALILGYLIDDRNEFHVLARHGKTRNLAVWSLSALSESNDNLLEFAQPKGYPQCNFLVPPGGLDGPLGLRLRCILIRNLTQPIVNPICSTQI